MYNLLVMKKFQEELKKSKFELQKLFLSDQNLRNNHCKFCNFRHFIDIFKYYKTL